jgi:hypothetical protein
VSWLSLHGKSLATFYLARKPFTPNAQDGGKNLVALVRQPGQSPNLS